jgi:hypothetical protein
VFDLDNAPAPESEPYLDSLPNPALGPSPEPPVEAKAADDADEIVPESDVREDAVGKHTARRLGSFIELSRRDAAASSPESAPPEPVHLVVETGDGPWPSRTARWTSAPEGSRWNSARRTYVGDVGQFRLRVNDRDYEVDMGAELASTSVTVLLVGLHVFVTLSETGELLRELRLNPEHDFRPE